MTDWIRTVIAFLMLMLLAWCCVFLKDVSRKLMAYHDDREYVIDLTDHCHARWPRGGDRLEQCVAGNDTYSGSKMYRKDL